MATVTLWLLIATGVLVGALIGGAIALFALRRGEPAGGSLRHEFDDYRSEVAEHYAETARRVDALTHAYKAVYDHLEDGAYRLVGEGELRERLDDASHEPVTIEGIGQRALQRPSDRETGRAGAGRDSVGQDDAAADDSDEVRSDDDRPLDDADRRT